MRDAESRTAILVCAGRAAAHGRTQVAAFSDPTAAALLPDDVLAGVEAYRAGRPPGPGTPARMQRALLRANEAIMVPRTVAIDDAVRAAAPLQMVTLGAGLDGRPWRMPGLADTVVFEVDHPASQERKRARSGRLPATAREVRFVPVDFTRDDLDGALAAAGHDPGTATLWLWEGVVPYLSRPQVEQTLAVVARRSAPGSTLVVSYLAPSLVAAAGRRLAGLALRRSGGDVFRDEPQRTFLRAPALRELLARYGYAVTEDRDLVEIAEVIGAETAAMGAAPRIGRIAVARRA